MRRRWRWVAPHWRAVRCWVLIPFIFVGISPALAPPMAGAAGRCLIAAGRGGISVRSGRWRCRAGRRGGGVFAGGGVGCAGGGGCACCLAGGALVRDGAASTGGAAAAAGKGPNNVILASASSDSSCTMRCAPRLLKAWMRSARWPCSNACSAVLVPAMLPCGAVPCGAVQGEGGGRFEQRLAEHAAVLKLKGWHKCRTVPRRQCRGSPVVLPAKSMLKMMTWAVQG